MARDGRTIEAEQVVGQQIVTDSTDQPLDFLQGAGVLNILNSMQVYFGRLNIPPGLTPAEIDAIRADPQPEHYELGLRDTPLTNPTKPTVTRVFVNLPPDPFPGTPGDLAPQPSTNTSETDTGPRTPLQMAKMLHEAAKTVKMQPRMRSWADVDPPLEIPGGGSDDGPQDAPIEGDPFIPPILDRPLPGPGVPRIDTARIIDEPIEAGRIGWDIGNVGVKNWPGQAPFGGQQGYIDYRIGPFNTGEFGSQDVLTATLVWDRYIKVKNVNFNSTNFNSTPDILEVELENLDLEVYFDTGALTTPVYTSNSTFNNVEHVYFPLPQTINGLYLILRVRWQSQEYDLTSNNALASVKYAVSWRSDTFDSRPDFAAALNERSTDGAAAPAEPISLQTVSSLIYNLGATQADANYEDALDMDNNGILDVRDISAMIFRLSAG